MKISKNNYIKGFFGVVIVLALVRCAFPGVAESKKDTAKTDSVSSDSAYALSDSIDQLSLNEVNAITGSIDSSRIGKQSIFINPDGSLPHHPIFSVPHFGKTFPDMNDVQLVAANKWGVQPVENREAAAERKGKLVYVGSNPYFYIDELHSSIPYLVPKASVLLQEIGKTFFDSLQIKGIPLHKIIVTSVMRTREDVTKLRTHNQNASRNSCHQYGTTFDVCYNRYQTVSPPDETRRKVRNDSLKWVLSEVLRDMREKKRCYVKYEVHQGCFHITCR